MNDLLAIDRFEEFWRAYPRRTAKAAAKKSWERATQKIKADPDAIMAGVRRYVEACVGKDQQYIAHPATWLNQQRWLDEEAEKPAQQAYSGDGLRLGGIVSTSRIAHELRDKLLERTRHEGWPRIEEAGRRCGVAGSEFWGCLEVELRRRAWEAAVEEASGRGVCPSVIEITRDDWIEAKLRVESRGRHMRGMQTFGINVGVNAAI